ncbi:hypothetical protein KIPB_003859 [Kipferlia bialata]|uniref:Transmembrane protein n=1 Tax=Kipferlia bialata TaxID=797122 RepID=A0A9K3CTL6_9EUKA|nr:hypothetical protein KIPB_003859 [Kipferlia bialata]|eukprot:g3859.t1
MSPSPGYSPSSDPDRSSPRDVTRVLPRLSEGAEYNESKVSLAKRRRARKRRLRMEQPPRTGEDPFEYSGDVGPETKLDGSHQCVRVPVMVVDEAGSQGQDGPAELFQRTSSCSTSVSYSMSASHPGSVSSPSPLPLGSNPSPTVQNTLHILHTICVTLPLIALTWVFNCLGVVASLMVMGVVIALAVAEAFTLLVGRTLHRSYLVLMLDPVHTWVPVLLLAALPQLLSGVLSLSLAVAGPLTRYGLLDGFRLCRYASQSDILRVAPSMLTQNIAFLVSFPHPTSIAPDSFFEAETLCGFELAHTLGSCLLVIVSALVAMIPRPSPRPRSWGLFYARTTLALAVSVVVAFVRVGLVTVAVHTPVHKRALAGVAVALLASGNVLNPIAWLSLVVLNLIFAVSGPSFVSYGLATCVMVRVFSSGSFLRSVLRGYISDQLYSKAAAYMHQRR